MAAEADRAGAAFEEAGRRLAGGESRAAVALLEDAVSIDPRVARAWRLLGDIRLVAGEVSPAQTAYDNMLAALVPDARLSGPVRDLAAGRIAEAEAALRAFVAAEPTSLPAAHVMAEVLARRGELSGAAALLEHCVERAPNFHLARLSLALAQQRLGRPEAALAHVDRLLTLDGANHRARMTRAALLAELGDYAGASAETATILTVFPDQPHAWLLHGHGLRTLGRIDEAIAAYHRAIALRPGLGEAYWSLSNLKSYRFDEAELSAMQAALADASTPTHECALLAFALGKAAEDAGQFEAAFGHFSKGASAERAHRPYRAADTSAAVAAAKAIFTPAFFARREGWGDPAADPIFIVGLPRSGSTLVDQILCSHPEIEGLQELMDVQLMADWAATQPGGYPAALSRLPREAVGQLGRDYLARTRPRRRLGRPRFTDKAPWNLLHAGLIATMLPNARIVDVRRHPLAVGLSAYKQHFAGGFDFSYDLADIGRYYADYVELMAHFDAVLPRPPHRVIYERLVADAEGETRRLLDDLGLPFDPACLRFFDTQRPVATPSSEQVRRPIFTDALDQWRNYEAWLDSLKAALGPVLDAYPDPPAGVGS